MRVAITIRQAEPREVPWLAEIERRAAVLFEPWRDRLALDDGEPTPLEELREAQARGQLFVAESDQEKVVGWYRLGVIDGHGHLYEIDVLPELGGRGIGRRLVEHSLEVARQRGHRTVTLTTFRDVPWNRPFYERLGFVLTTADGPEMKAILAEEASWGFDPTQRCVMERIL
ncbi:MAG: GNAT family N-acetyltransferase [Acidobacteriota bacterium]